MWSFFQGRLTDEYVVPDLESTAEPRRAVADVPAQYLPVPAEPLCSLPPETSSTKPATVRIKKGFEPGVLRIPGEFRHPVQLPREYCWPMHFDRSIEAMIAESDLLADMYEQGLALFDLDALAASGKMKSKKLWVAEEFRVLPLLVDDVQRRSADYTDRSTDDSGTDGAVGVAGEVGNKQLLVKEADHGTGTSGTFVYLYYPRQDTSFPREEETESSTTEQEVRFWERTEDGVVECFDKLTGRGSGASVGATRAEYERCRVAEDEEDGEALWREMRLVKKRLQDTGATFENIKEFYGGIPRDPSV